MPPWRRVRGPATEGAGGADDVGDPGAGSRVDATAGEPESDTETRAASGGTVPTTRDAGGEVDVSTKWDTGLEPVA
jgi:hypothetical protein